MSGRNPRRPLLVAFTDECTAQIGVLQGLAHGGKVRLWFFCDPFHRRWNDMKNALKKAGLWSDLLERLHCENLPSGPWKSCKWWGEMRETMLQHFQTFSFDNKLFQSLKHELRQEARHAGEVVDDLGDRETDKTVWLWLQRVSRMDKHNVICTTKTWFAPFTAMKEGVEQHYAYL